MENPGNADDSPKTGAALASYLTRNRLNEEATCSELYGPPFS
jgi:hypothetical protein